MLENQLSERLSLNGVWQFETDSGGGAITIPGAWEAQGYSADFATYRRVIDIPAAWRGARVLLRFGAASHQTQVSVNGSPVGGHEGLWTAHEFDVTNALNIGGANEIAVIVRKPSALDEGEGSYRTTLVGFIPYVATTFGGLWQDVDLIAHRAPAFESLRAEAAISFSDEGDVAGGALWCETRMIGLGFPTDEIEMLTEIVSPGGAVIRQHRCAVSDGETVSLTPELAPPEIALWQPDSPLLYTVRLSLIQRGAVIAQTERRVGFRELCTREDRLYLNAQSYALRGILSWGWNPEALAPIFTDAQITAEFERVRAFGFNLIKLCLFVPPPRLFELADQAGMLLWLELPLWWQRITPHLREQVMHEYADIMRAAQHHPSIVIYSLGCELDAHMLDADLAAALTGIVQAETTGCLLCDNSGSGEAYGGLKLDLADFSDYHFYADLQYFTPLCDHFRRDWSPPRAWIFGEYADADDYRDLAALSADGERPAWLRYQGVEGNPTRWAYAEQPERMAALRLPFSDASLQALSRRQSFAMRKNILEKTRARRGIGGYVLTGLRDTPIMTSGVFDDALRPKYDADQWRMFNADTVLILERGRGRAWTFGGDRPAPLDRHNVRSGESTLFRLVVAHAGAALPRARVRWQWLTPSGEIAAQGESAVEGEIVGGVPREIVGIDLYTPPRDQPGRFTLKAWLDGIAANEWHLWVYPPAAPISPRVRVYGRRLRELGLPFPAFEHPIAPYGDVIVTDTLDPVIQSALDKGARAILLALDANSPLTTLPVPFWRESIKLIHDHPAWGNFPHEGHADMQFYHLAGDRAFGSTLLPSTHTLTPIMSRLDARLFTLLHYAAEFHLPHTRLIASTLNLFGGMGDQVAGYGANIAAQHLLSQWIAHLLTV